VDSWETLLCSCFCKQNSKLLKTHRVLEIRSFESQAFEAPVQWNGAIPGEPVNPMTPTLEISTVVLTLQHLPDGLQSHPSFSSLKGGLAKDQMGLGGPLSLA
jgi:hypothetical protein